MVDKKIKIIKIIDETTFILNVGQIDGIDENTKFRIIDSNPEPIIDPDTEETIGFLETSKGTIEADQVQEKMTVARTQLHTKLNKSSLLSAMSALQPYETQYREELIVDETQITGGYGRSNNPIKIGDEVTILSDPS
ncbi:MAG: hypothetical protein ABF723_13725 [Lentilactobacillus hilgardii]|uniref:hypothetical protein n=1 Tax=Lentilactobacillus hilgardii TaxID=1588 RepID=UPI0039E7B8DC